MTRNSVSVDDDLHFLSTGVAAVHRIDAVNCDEAEITGSKIQEIWIKLTSLMHMSKRKINLCHW